MPVKSGTRSRTDAVSQQCSTLIPGVIPSASFVLNGLPLVRSASPVAARRTGVVGVVGSKPATPTKALCNNYSYSFPFDP